MSRFMKIGLLASTMLVLAAPAAAEPGRDREGASRGEWSRGGRSGQLGGGGAERQRNESAPERQPAPAREQAAPVVQTAPVPASAAPGGQWRQQRDTVARPGTPGAGNWQGRNPGETRAPPVVAAPQPPQQPPQRNWSRNDGAPGQGNWNRNDRNDRGAWNGNDRNERNDRGTWNGNDRGDRGNNDWQQGNRQRDDARERDRSRPQPGYNYQRRLQDRDRWADTRRWDNGWRSSNRYDWQRYRAQNRSFYHLPRYYAPYGWNRGYSRLSIGIFLNNVLFSSDYWIDDPYEYRLPPAYGPLRWVRYYDDALLVDIRDGYVVDVIHDFFW